MEGEKRIMAIHVIHLHICSSCGKTKTESQECAIYEEFDVVYQDGWDDIGEMESKLLCSKCLAIHRNKPHEPLQEKDSE